LGRNEPFWAKKKSNLHENIWMTINRFAQESSTLPFTPGSPLPKAALFGTVMIIAAAAALCDFQPFADFHSSLAFPRSLQVFPPAMMVFSQ
jgi:hypothetical protein